MSRPGDAPRPRWRLPIWSLLALVAAAAVACVFLVPRPPSDRAPHGEPRGHSRAENLVMNEIIWHGKGTPAELTTRLAGDGHVLKAPEVAEALECWERRGWLAQTDGMFHITQALYAYIH